jgi:hypothetical protein
VYVLHTLASVLHSQHLGQGQEEGEEYANHKVGYADDDQNHGRFIAEPPTFARQLDVDLLAPGAGWRPMSYIYT